MPVFYSHDSFPDAFKSKSVGKSIIKCHGRMVDLEKAADGTVTLTTECFENIALMMPFTICLMWTAKKGHPEKRDGQIRNKIWFGSIIWACGKTAFLFSVSIEFLQLFLRLGTFQLSDICYNTLGGVLGGIIYWIGWKLKCELPKNLL